MIKKIIALDQEVADWDLELFENDTNPWNDIELLIYAYNRPGYEGDGTAVYLDDQGNWHLSDMGHCSCFGPFEHLNTIPYTKDEVISILKKNVEDKLWGKDSSKKVLEALNELDAEELGR